MGGGGVGRRSCENGDQGEEKWEQEEEVGDSEAGTYR